MGEVWAPAGIEEEFNVVGGFGAPEYFASGWQLKPGREVYTRVYFVTRTDEPRGRSERDKVFAVHIPRTDFIRHAALWRRKFWEAPH